MSPLSWNLILALVWAAITGNFSGANLLVGFGLGYLILGFALRDVPDFARYREKMPRVLMLLTHFLRDLLVSNLPGRLTAAMERALDIFGLAVCLTLVWFGWANLSSAWMFQSMQMKYFQMPEWVLLAVFVACFLLPFARRRFATLARGLLCLGGGFLWGLVFGCRGTLIFRHRDSNPWVRRAITPIAGRPVIGRRSAWHSQIAHLAQKKPDRASIARSGHWIWALTPIRRLRGIP